MKNPVERHDKQGNFCNDCCSRANHKLRWVAKKRLVLRKEKEIQQAQETGFIIKDVRGRVGIRKLKKEHLKLCEALEELSIAINRNWGIDMDEEYPKMVQFQDLFHKSFFTKK